MVETQHPRAAGFDLQTLPENVADIIVVYGPEWRFLYVNAAFEQLSHHRRDQVLGKTLAEAFPETLGTVFEERYREAMATQTPVFFEGYYTPTARWYEVRAFPTPHSLTVIASDITERKLTQQALLESEERFRKVFEHAPIGLAIVNSKTHRLLQVNAAMTQILGYSSDELAKLTFDEFTHPGDRSVTANIMRAFERGDFAAHEWTKRYIRKDGSVITAIVRVAVLHGHGDDIIHLGMIEDITPRLNAEQAAKQHRERLALAQEAAGIGVFDIDLRTRIGHCTPEVEKIYGVPRGTFEKDAALWRKLVHPEDRAAANAIVDRSIREQADGQVSFRIVRPDGEIRWIFNIWRIFSDADSARAVGVNVDITDRKTTEEALRLSEKKFHSLVEFLPDGILVVVDFDIVYANPAAGRLFGAQDPLELLGRKLTDLVPADRLPVVQADFAGFFREQRLAPVHEGAARRLDGTRVDVECSLTRFQHNGQPAGLVMLHDITDRVEARRVLIEYQDRLRKMGTELTLAQARERREVAKNIHDGIGQDLAAARLQLQMLGEDSLPGEAAVVVAKAQELIARAIDHARSVTFGLSPPALFEIGLGSALEGLIEDTQKLYGLKIELHKSLQSRGTLSETQRVLFFRAIRELLMNTVKHAHATSVSIRMDRSPDHFSVTVTDDGVGFVPSASAFHNHFGLFSIREQIESLGGSLDIRSQPGAGTTVLLSLPLNHVDNTMEKHQ